MLAAKQEQRVAHRYSIADSRICSISIDGAEPEVIGNLSYGGFSMLSPKQSVARNERLPFKGTFLGLDFKGEVLKVYQGVTSEGFSFCHDSAALLVFFNRYLEKMRLGSTLTKVPDHLLKDRFKEGGWLCFHGDGPSDLRIKAENEVIREAIVSFRVGEDYFDVLCQDGIFTTRMSLDKQGVAARMSKTKEVDVDILRQAICILCGLTSGTAVPEANTLLSLAVSKVHESQGE